MSDKDSVLGDIDPIKQGGHNEPVNQADGDANQPPEKDGARVNSDPVPERGSRNYHPRGGATGSIIGNRPE